MLSAISPCRLRYSASATEEKDARRTPRPHASLSLVLLAFCLLAASCPAGAQNLFLPQQTFAAGNVPSSVALGDFNNDGQLDMVVANLDDNTVSVLLNITAPGAVTPSFAARQTFAVGTAPTSIAVGDFNGDGKLDLVVTNLQNNTVSVLLNTMAPGATTPSFAAQQTFAVGQGPSVVAVGDFNSDGKPDLAVTNVAASTVSVLANITAPGAATLSFAAQQTFPVGIASVGGTPRSVAVADFNGDGRPDLVVANENNFSVSVLLNTTTAGAAIPSFAGQQTFRVGAVPSSAVVADFNGDGRPDLAVTNQDDNTVSVLLNTTSPGAMAPTFAPQQTFPVGSLAFPTLTGDLMAAGDFNGDGRPDLAVVNHNDNTVSILLNTIAPGAATPSFAVQQVFAVGTLPFSVAVADFNGDGKPDLAVANGSDNTVSVLLNSVPPIAPSSNGVSLTPQQTFPTGSTPEFVAVGDFNGDGKPDLVAANFGSNTLSVYLDTATPGASAPSFAAQQVFFVGSAPRSIAVGDFNSDGKPDLVAANQTGNTLGLLLNTTAPGATTPSFAAQQIVAVGSAPKSVSVGDFNGDGKPDLALVNSSDNTVGVLLNTTVSGAATPSFATQQTFAVGSGPISAAVADVNGDGKPDLIVANEFDSTVSVLLNTTTPGAATASFAAQHTFAVGGLPFDVKVADVNGDGKPDLIVANFNDNTAGVLLNTTAPGAATPSFAAQQVFSVGNTPSAIAAADFNGDGKPDLLTANFIDNTVSVLLNATTHGAGTPSFAAQRTFSVGNSPLSVATGDFNGDGHFDLAVANQRSASIGVFLNLGGTTATVASSAGSSVFGQPVSFTVAITKALSTSPNTPTGGVQFQDSGSGINIGSPISLGGSGGIATGVFSTNTLTAGTHAFSGLYSGDANFWANTLIPIVQSVTRASSATALATSNNASAFGATVTFTATVTDVSSGSTGTPAGSVTFMDGASALGAGTLNGSGIATFSSASLGAGLHSITAVYNGDGNFTGSTSTAVSESIGQDGTSTVLTSTANPSALGTTLILFATVTDVSAGSTGTPTGSVTFMDGASALGTGTLNGLGVATFTTPLLSAGSHSITAIYGGDINFIGSTSTVLTQRIAIPPTVSKAFSPTALALNSGGINPTISTLTLTISNPNSSSSLTGISVSDVLPSGMTIASTPNLSNNGCGGTAGAVANSNLASLTSGTLAAGANCTITVAVTGHVAGALNNTVQPPSSNEGGTGVASNTATLTVVAPPNFSNAFSPFTIPLNGTATLTFTLNNPNAATPLTGIQFSDPLPSAPAILVVSSTPNVSNTCGGTLTAAAGTGTITLSGASLNPGASCTVKVDVQGTTAGTANNVATVVSAEGGTGQAATATLQMEAPPTIAQAFGAKAISLNGTTSLTFTITNPGGNAVAETGVAFTDTLPAGLVVTMPNGLSSTCGGTSTAVAGSGSISLTGGTIAVGSSCTLTVNVTGTTSGVKSSTTGNVTSTNGGTGNTASASLTVASPPAITKVFGAAAIPLNGSTSLTFIITNPVINTISLTGIAFTDSLPAGLVVATPNGLTNTCGGAAAATEGSSSVSLSAGTIAAAANCTVSVNITGTTAGIKNNSVQVTSMEGGTGNTATADITVASPPAIIEAFGAASIPLNGSASLTFTIQNNNPTIPLTGAAFSDTLPAGLVVSTPNGITGSCGGGAIIATQATNVISLTGASLASSTSCTFAVNVTGAAAGMQNNRTGNVTSAEGGTGGTASASINVVAPPSIAKAFGGVSVSLNGTTSLAFTIVNPGGNAVAETGVAFTDTLPAGLVVATPNGLSSTCGGTSTAVAGSGSISLTSGTIAASSSCTLTVNVTGTTSGVKNNTTGNVTSTNGGTGNTASASLTVASPPTITKVFGAAAIPLNGSTSLTFIITNPVINTLSLTGIAFTDSLPAGLVVAMPNGFTNTCGGAAAATAGSSSVSLSAGTIAAAANCEVSVNITGTAAGIKNNSVQVTSTEGGTGNTATANITVASPPAIIEAFGGASIPLNGSASLTFTIQNNNPTIPLTGVAFSDTLPAGLVVSIPNGLAGSCGRGTIRATQTTNVISLSGASLAPSASCTFAVNVTGIAAGTQGNTTGNVTSTEGGPGGPASASINVVAPPSIARAFAPNTIALSATTSLIFTITNPAPNVVALKGVAFTDTLPTGLTVTNVSATACGGTLTLTAPTAIALTGATIAVNSQCLFSVSVTGTASGKYTNTTGAVTSTNGGTGNTATASLTVASPPEIGETFGAASIPLNGMASLTFTINNPNTNMGLTAVAFTDNLPAGLAVATPQGVSSTCGAVTAIAGSGTVSLSGGTLASTASCAVTVNVQGTTAGVKNNSVQVASTEGGAGNTSNASITVVMPPAILKAFGAASIPVSGSTSLAFTIQNNNPATLTGIAFIDTLPAGLRISMPNGLTGSCGGGTIAGAAGSGLISLSGASLAASGSCAFAVNVTGVAAGTMNNVTSQITSIEGGTGGAASASIHVLAPPLIGEQFTPGVIAPNTNSALTFTIANPSANTVALTGVAFADALPAGIVVSSPNGITGSCGGGTIIAPAGSGSISLDGAIITAAGSCSFSVNVTGAMVGNYANTTGKVTSSNGGGGSTATANLSVQVPDLTLTKTHVGAFVPGETGATFTITAKNSGLGPTAGSVTLIDTPPDLMAVTAISGSGWTCTLGTHSCLRSDVLAPGASYPPITVVATLGVNIASTFTNTATVSGGGETNTANDTATDSATVGPPLKIVPHDPNVNFLVLPAGGSGRIAFDVTSNTSAALTNIVFTCNGLPAGGTCSFDQEGINMVPVTVTMTIMTDGRHPGSQPPSRRFRRATYAALLLPLLGLVGCGIAGHKRRKAKYSVIAIFGGLLLLLLFVGCGGSRAFTTPAGIYAVTVTATGTSGTSTATATTQISLTVRP